MKKSSIISIVILLALIVAGVLWYDQRAPAGTEQPEPIGVVDETNSDESAEVSGSVKVSSTLSEYRNAELGFSVKYPNTWQAEDANAGVTFIVPTDKNQVSTIGSIQANVQVTAATCAFPPVTTVKERSTLKVGAETFNTISMSNTVQGRTYFNRMYSLQKGALCYMFSFASIALSPSSKGLTGSNLTQAENNNKAIVNTADAQFIEMVKTFAFITGPAGVDETTAAPKR